MTFMSTSGGWSFGWWWVTFMVVCMALMMLMMVSGGFRGSRWLSWCGLGGRRQRGPQRPEQTLADRLARGEIDVDEYERRLTAVRGASELDRPV